MHFLGISDNHIFQKGAKSASGVGAVLFLYCSQDTLTPHAMGLALMQAMPVPAEMVICRGGHLEGIIQDAQYYSRRLRRFLDNSQREVS
jgi:pimeloyl-ACP methyl ester carboxylesterase